MEALQCSVLIVDDSESDRYIIQRLLKRAAVQGDIHVASHGQEALDFLKDYKNNRLTYPNGFPPDFIFLDINMPIMNGFEFLEAFAELKAKDNRYQSIVFAMVTSSNSSDDIKKANEFGFVENYITKKDMSLETLQKLLRDAKKTKSA